MIIDGDRLKVLNAPMARLKIGIPGAGVYAGVNAVITGGSISADTYGISISLPAYLTTAMASNATFAGTGFTTESTAGSDIVGTLFTNGISIGVPAYLTTTPAIVAITNIKVSAGTYSTNRSDITFADSNGVAFGLETNGVITATVATNYQSQGAYLTTAALSQDSSKYAGTTAGITGGSLTVDTLGIAINLPAYLTTAMASNAQFAGTGTSATNASITLNSDGLAISVNPPAGGGAGTGFTSASTAGSDIVGTLNTNGLSIGVPAYLTTAQPTGAYLTTAALSQDSSNYAGINGAITGGSITINTSGVSIALPAYLTTAALSADTSNYAGTNTSVVTTAGTDLSFAINTTGATIAYPKWITTYAVGAGTGFTSATTAGTNIVGTLDANGLSMGIPAYLTTAAAGAGATASLYPDAWAFPNFTTVSTYYSGSISQGAGGGSTQSGYTFSLYAAPMVLPAAVAFSNVRMVISNVTAAGTGSASHVYSLGFYTKNANTLSLVKGYYGAIRLSQNSSNAWTYSVGTVSTGINSSNAGGLAGISLASIQSSQGNVNSSNQINGSSKLIRIDDGTMTTLNAGQYWIVYGNCWRSSGANVLSLAGVAQAPGVTQLSTGFLDAGVNTSASAPMFGSGWGVFSTNFTSQNTAATFFPLPNAIALSDISSNSISCQRYHFPLLRGI